jgi:hypothetical protein
VDGEIGRFCFSYYDVNDPQGGKVFEGNGLFPRRQGKQWYLTEGFHEQALLLGTSQQSYRKFQQRFNRWRRQERQGTVLTSLREASEREGLAVLRTLTETSANVLKQQGFDSQGQPHAQSDWRELGQAVVYTKVNPSQRAGALARVSDQMEELGLTKEHQRELAQRAKREVFEVAGETVNLSVDDVGVKKQKAQREQRKSRPPALSTPTTVAADSDRVKHPKVQNSVAYVEHQAQHYTFTGRSVSEVLYFCLALLLNTGHVLKRLCFFTDGQNSLQQAVLAAFSWHPAVTMLLDWYHLVKKCKEHLSTALKGRHLRNQHARAVLRLVWFGARAGAVKYLKAIPVDEIKDPQGIEKLLTYLERNRDYIGCYALRRQLGLRNSSNRVERSNYLVTAERQKKNAMSWSAEGSYALTALRAVVCNGFVAQWVTARQIPLEFAQQA